MNGEMSKREKKLARELIEKGLHEEFKRGLTEFDTILQKWKNEPDNVRESYSEIFKAVKDFDKHIAQRYDYLTGSMYDITIVLQLVEGLYDISEIDDFNEDTKESIIRMVNRRKTGDF